MKIRAVISRVTVIGVLLALCPVIETISAEPNSLPSGAVTCEGSAYIIDPDPKGTNVRSAPGRESSVLYVIPYDFEGTEVEVSAFSDGWVLIRSADGPTTDFHSKRQGWIHVSLLATTAVHPSGRKVPLYSSSDKRSPVIEMIAGEKEAKLEGCIGGWRHVKIGKQRGWLAPGDSCGNPVTTCP